MSRLELLRPLFQAAKHLLLLGRRHVRCLEQTAQPISELHAPSGEIANLPSEVSSEHVRKDTGSI